MIFQTKSGSIYEVDTTKRLMRRNSKEVGDFKRFDEAFVHYEYAPDIEVGSSALFFFPGDKFVRTSRVLRVLPDFEG